MRRELAVVARRTCTCGASNPQLLRDELAIVVVTHDAALLDDRKNCRLNAQELQVRRATTAG
ncbi:hypothetical protein BJ980_002440 [Nocardioides daedukensis]|uniref:Uncharacterized protein n=1 Tax=Nocardioides daedukensis TaxID=634462 RepID=A0A7Y9UQQ3_9ACTN|nr:hypothetical protein [Nocardioides daedukensis]NYG59517.1 hypothetical protein [Nocardioides daedukensis]